MSNKRDYDTSYELERVLAKSIERVRESISKQSALKREIVKLRLTRQGIASVPQEVKEWFEDTEGLEEGEERE